METLLNAGWYTNVAFSKPGLERLGFETSAVLENDFKVPMGAIAASLNDPIDSSGEPVNYVLGKTWADTPQVFLIIGAASEQSIELAVKTMRAEALAADCAVTYVERGATLPDAIEHFGFRDGISQVGCRGRLSSATTDFLTPRYFAGDDPNGVNFAKPGQPLVWPGQFVFGYPNTQSDDLSQPGEICEGGPSWMHNGSFLVFRRLSQDVKAFREFGVEAAATLSAGLQRSVTANEAEAMLVGRWPDGTPLLADNNGPDPDVSADEMRVNNFDYRRDIPQLTVLDGNGLRAIPPVKSDRRAQLCPKFAHIRKVNPRGMPTDQPRLTESLQMMRRGIPFGPLYDSQPTADRGLLFLAYMTSVDRQFHTLTAQWMNNAFAPEVNTPGHDMLVGQAAANTPRQCAIMDSLGTPQASLTSTKIWVTSTGGGIFFAPGLDFLATL
jgi:Dyp-type peroxidase family